MKKVKILIAALFVSLSLVACTSQKEKNNTVITETDSSNYKYIENGAFYINKKGEVISKTEAKNYKKIVEWYFEPLCPHCIVLESEVSPYLLDIMGEETLIKYVPLSFLGRPKNSDESFVSYSDTIAANIISIAEHDPKNTFQYIKEVINQSFFDKISKLADKNEQDKAIEEVYTKTLSGTKLAEIKKSFDTSLKTVRSTTKFTSKNEDLKSKTESGRVTVPLVYVVGEDKALRFKEGENPRKILEEKLK